MKRNLVSKVAAAISCAGLLLPPTVMAQSPAATPSPAALRTSDVALRQGGLVVGQVITPAGAPQAGATVVILYGDREVVRTTSDRNGIFAAQGLRGGQYQLVTENGYSLCRFWAADTAPPAVQQAALIVSDESVVRGQYGGPMHEWVEWIKCHPYITAGVVAAAIEIPIALSDDFSSGS